MKKIEEVFERLEWNYNGNEIQMFSPEGEDFNIYLRGETPEEILGELENYFKGFNPVAEAMLWVDSEGKGQNGAPDFEELLEDKKYMREEVERLIDAISLVI